MSFIAITAAVRGVASWAVVVCAATVASAQSAGKVSGSDPEYLLRKWETDEGLPDDSATAIVQSPEGYLWIGTFGGFVRFDGGQPGSLRPGLQLQSTHPGDHPNWAAWRIIRAYRWATWGALTGWVGHGWSEPAYFNYGDNVYYSENQVYYGDQASATTEQYAQQAQDIASSARKSRRRKATGETQSVEGMADKKSQRAAWGVAGKERPIMETGIYNLTQDTAPALVHVAVGQTQQWLIVRIPEPTQ
jgi:hypothetical protein